MTTLNLDNEKIKRMSFDILRNLSDSGAHPVEVVVALAQCIGRVVVSLDGAGVSDIAKRDIVDLAIKQMAASIEAGTSNIITQ